MSVSGLGPFELYSVSLTGGPSVKLNGPLVAEGNVSHFIISRDSAHVIYRADQDADEVYELYSVPITGGAVERVSGPMVEEGSVSANGLRFKISPEFHFFIAPLAAFR